MRRVTDSDRLAGIREGHAGLMRQDVVPAKFGETIAAGGGDGMRGSRWMDDPGLERPRRRRLDPHVDAADGNARGGFGGGSH